MDLSIIIPSHNTKDLLDRCLTSIFASLRQSQLNFEVIVVDNASEDGTIELLNKKYHRVVKIFNNTNLGYGRANNQAIRRAKGKFILLLNSDIKVLNEAIDRMYSFAKEHQKTFVGGKLLNEDLSPQDSCGPMYTLPVVALMLFGRGDSLHLTRYSPKKLTEVDWVSGACLMGTKQAFQDIGLFDERIFMYMEEIDFLYRAGRKGYATFFLPEAKFIHAGAASSGGRRKPVVNIYQGLIYFYRKHRSIIEQQLILLLLKLKAYLAIGLGKILGNRQLVTLYEQALQLV